MPGFSDDGSLIAFLRWVSDSQCDILLVPAETAHQFQNISGEFVILSVHMLMPESK